MGIRTCWTKLVCITTSRQKSAMATTRWMYSRAVRILGLRTLRSIPDSFAWTRRKVCSGSMAVGRTCPRFLGFCSGWGMKTLPTKGMRRKIYGLLLTALRERREKRRRIISVHLGATTRKLIWKSNEEASPSRLAKFKWMMIRCDDGIRI